MAFDATPLSPAEARAALEVASERDAVFATLLRAIRSRTSYAGLLAVRGGSARGRLALLAGGVERAISTVELPLEAVPAFRRAVHGAQPEIAAIATGDSETDASLVRLCGAMPPAALLLPISLRGRVVALAIGHRGDRELHFEDVSEVTSLAGAVSDALMRLILVAKGAAAESGSEAPSLAARAAELERDQDWESLVDVLRQQLARANPAEAAPLFYRLGAVLSDQLGRLEEAAEAWDHARELAADDVDVLDSLAVLYHQLERWEDAVDVLLERAHLSDDVPRRSDLLRQVARIYSEHLGDRESAYLVLQTALKDDPLSDSIAQRLEDLAADTGNWVELVADDAERAVALEDTDPVAAAELWVKVGRLYHEKLGNIDQAIAATRRALALDDAHVDALAALCELQQRAEAWIDLVETLRRRVELEANVDDRVELRLAIGDLFENHLSEPSSAIATYNEVLDDDPTCMLALVSLERLHREQSQWRELVAVQRRLAELRDDNSERIRLGLEIAGVLARELDDTAAAIEAYEEIRDLEPDNAAALAGLENLYERANESERYMEVLEAQLDSDPDDGRRVRLYARLASAWENDFERPERAAACLEKLAGIEPGRREHYDALARIYREAGDWDALLATHESALAELEDPEVRAEIQLERAAVFERELDDRGRAIDCLTEALDLGARRGEILEGLARLYRLEGEHQRAVDVLLLRLDAGELDAAERADTYFEIGRLTSSELGDPAGGERFLRRALELEPAHLRALEQLAQLLESRGIWREAAEIAGRAAAAATDHHELIRLHCRAGRLWHEKVGDSSAAEPHLTAAFELDPRCAEAAGPLAEIRYRAQDWAGLEPLLALLIDAAEAERRPPAERGELLVRAGRCAEATGDPDRALALYARAQQADPAAVAALAASAALCYQLERWSSAADHYQKLLVRRPDGEDIAEIVLRLGLIHARNGDPERALDMLNRCLSVDPDNAEALEAVIEIHSGRGDFSAVIDCLRAKLGGAAGAERAGLLQHIGDIYRDKLDNPQKAIASYLEALELAGDDHQLLQKVLDIYAETRQWKRAVEMIERFLDLETDSIRRASYYIAAATISREELLEREVAADYLEQALDCFFADFDRLDKATYARALETFRTIDAMMTEARDWKRQEQAYRRMIKRVGDRDKPVAARLWHSLGEVYRTRLGHYESALESFNVAQKLDPDNSLRVSILAELSMKAQGEKAASIDRLIEVIASKPTAYEAYRTLFRIHVELELHDRAWCIANTLVALDRADAEIRSFHDRLKPRRLPPSREVMSTEIWKRVRHREEDNYIGAIFSAICEGVALSTARPAKDFGLKRRDQADPDAQVSAVVPLLSDLVDRLDVPAPAIYLQPEEDGQIMLANCAAKSKLATALVLRKQLFDCTRREAAFLAAKLLAFLRPERFLKIALPTNGERRTALHAAIALVEPAFPIPAEVREAATAFLPQIRERLSPAMSEQLAVVVRRLIAAAPTLDTGRWSDGAEATAHRVGLLFCGDAVTAARLIAREQQLVGGPTADEKIHELAAFSVSEDFFTAREQLGLTVDASR